MKDTGTRDAVVVELDFGSTPTRSKTFTVTDGRILPAKSVLMNQSGVAPTGKSADENEMDSFMANCLPGTGSFTANIFSLFGPVVGKFKFLYVVR